MSSNDEPDDDDGERVAKKQKVQHSLTSDNSNQDLAGLRKVFGESDSTHEIKTRVELLIMAVSAAVRDKVGWMEKLMQPSILKRWRTEALARETSHGDLRVTEEMVDFAFAELHHLAGAQHQHHPGVEPASVDGVYQSNQLIPAGLKNALLDNVKALENVPELEQDWHPGSKRQVLDLVHPSLYCSVKGVSCRFVEPQYDKFPGGLGLGLMGSEPRTSRIETLVAEKSRADPYESKRFQWLPAEFAVDEAGQVAIQSYINNLHPKHHAQLYLVIASVFGCMLPLFEAVLRDLLLPQPRNRVDAVDYYAAFDAAHPEPDEEKEPVAHAQWLEARKPEHPSVPEFAAPAHKGKVDLRSRKLQVIVKLANIVLTPEQPTYPGGAWHVEGMKNENIVATGIYYYHNENVTPSRLSFRVAVDEPGYDQNEHEAVAEVYGVENDQPMSQLWGSVSTLQDRCIAFPNVFQHRVEPFSLLDRTKPGHRKILVFFLVDPARRIISTAEVPPQQRAWFREELEQQKAWVLSLPQPVRDMVLSYWQPGMSHKNAQEYREALMKERKYIISQVTSDLFERPFSLCEH